MIEILSDAAPSSTQCISANSEAAKNPLFLRSSYHQRCPHPVFVPGTGTRKPCQRPSCCVCGQNALRQQLVQVRQRLGAERTAGLWDGLIPRRRYHFVTLRLLADSELWLGPDPRRWGPLSLDMMSGAGKVLSEVRRAHQPSGWPGVKLDYLCVIHLKPVISPGLHTLPDGRPAYASQVSYVSHVHVLLCEHADAGGHFQPSGQLQRRLADCWNTHICHKLGIAVSTVSEDPPGLVYCLPCRDVVDAAAYMLWEYGRPWDRGHWLFPRRARRVRLSRAFRVPCRPSTDLEDEGALNPLAQAAQVSPSDETIAAGPATEEPIAVNAPTEELPGETAATDEPGAPSLLGADALAGPRPSYPRKLCRRSSSPSLIHMGNAGSRQFLKSRRVLAGSSFSGRIQCEKFPRGRRPVVPFARRGSSRERSSSRERRSEEAEGNECQEVSRAVDCSHKTGIGRLMQVGHKFKCLKE